VKRQYPPLRVGYSVFLKANFFIPGRKGVNNEEIKKGVMIMNLKTQRVSGFTLIELLVAIVIIAILMGIVLGLSGVARRKSAESKAQADLQAIAGALEEYRMIAGGYPASLALLTNASSRLPQNLKDAVPASDPWGNAFVYTNVTKYAYTLKSQGIRLDIADDDLSAGSP